MSKVLEKNDTNEILKEKLFLQKLLEEICNGVSLEEALAKHVRANKVKVYLKGAKNILIEHIKTPEFKLAIELLINYDKVETERLKGILANILNFLEKKAINRRMREELEKKLTIKAGVSSISLIVTTVTIFILLPKTLTKIGIMTSETNYYYLLISLITIYIININFVMDLLLNKRKIFYIEIVLIIGLAIGLALIM